MDNLEDLFVGAHNGVGTAGAAALGRCVARGRLMRLTIIGIGNGIGAAEAAVLQYGLREAVCRETKYPRWIMITQRESHTIRFQQCGDKVIEFDD